MAPVTPVHTGVPVDSKPRKPRKPWRPTREKLRVHVPSRRPLVFGPQPGPNRWVTALPQLQPFPCTTWSLSLLWGLVKSWSAVLQTLGWKTLGWRISWHCIGRIQHRQSRQSLLRQCSVSPEQRQLENTPVYISDNTYSMG